MIIIQILACVSGYGRGTERISSVSMTRMIPRQEARRDMRPT